MATIAPITIKMPDLVPLKRALISVSDKTGLAEFATALAARGVELVSTGGTKGMLSALGLNVRDVTELTGFPEIMDGRVKTLHPGVHGGLLAVRDHPDHADAMVAHNILPIDLLIVNLYPFEQVRHSGADAASIIENIDIGGPAMVRAAAKNHAYVSVVTDPDDYQSVLDALGVIGKPRALAVSTATRTMRALSGCDPAGRMPMVSIAIVSGTLLSGQRASSSRSASRMAAWNFTSSAASDAALSDRMSTSTMPS